MHILRYEEMKSDITKELGKLSDFLGTGLTEKQLENVAKHTTFDAMRNRKTLFDFDMSETSPFVDAEVMKKDGGFFRQGKTGDGKKKLSQEMQTRVKEWCDKHFDFGLTFE
ncbi:luciferin sulfotransferase-like [Palaemon carinicauda]|uniref:luciferin sulfotransferase-like n=1 Tax=Palaemon carinicauda TaxID=392227 RepID=UPI0035B59A53